MYINIVFSLIVIFFLAYLNFLNSEANDKSTTNQLISDYICPKEKTSLLQNISTYFNPKYGFKLDYPSHWRVETEALMDPVVITFNPPKFEIVQLGLWIEQWPFTQTAKEVSESYIKSANESGSTITGTPFFKLEDNSSLSINGNEGYKIVYTYTGENGSPFAEMQVRTIVNNTMYTFIFTSLTDFFNDYIPIVNKIINSFELVNSTNALCYLQQNDSSNYKDIYKKNLEQLFNKINYSSYIDSICGFKLEYPSDWTIEKSKLASEMVFTSPIEYIGFSAKFQDKFLEKLGIFFTDVSANNSQLEEMAKSYIEAQTESYIGFNLIEFKSILLDNKPAYQAIYTYFDPLDQFQKKLISIFSIINNYMYRLDFLTESEKYDLYLPIIKNIALIDKCFSQA